MRWGHMSEVGSDPVEEEEVESPEEFGADVEPIRPAALRAAFLTLDTIQLPDWLKKRPSVMKSVPHFLKGPFRNALRLAMEDAVSEEVSRQERGWKLLFLLPRMLLFRPPREEVSCRRKSWQTGSARSREANGSCCWSLVPVADEQAAVARRRRRH